MSNSTERMDDGQGTARMDAGTARMDGSQGASQAGGGTVFANGQTVVLNGNNCVIESLISMGSGEADVYKIQIDGKPYALKHYKPNTPLSDTAKKLLTKIRDNPKDRVVKIFDFGSHNGRDFEIMEYAEGGTLGEYVKKNGAIRDNRLKDVVKQINEGLRQLHGYYKAIYQDLKPENIFFRDAQKSSLVLADFGISSVMQDGSEEVEVTASNTDLYGAPELARKGNNPTVAVCPAVDYFAMGITMYELWLGKQPFLDIKATTRERRIRNKDVDFPMDMPDDCKTLIQGLLDPNDKDRMGNEHIQKWLKGEALTPNTVKPDTVTGAVYKPLKFGNEFASSPKEMAALMEKYHDVGKDSLYDEIITEWLKEAGDLMLRSEIKNVISQYGEDRNAGLTSAIYTLDPERPFVSRAGKTCKSGEEIAEAIIADSAHYMDELKNPNASLYIYIAVTGGSQGKEVADTFCKYFKEYSPNRALTLISLKLQSDDGINIGSKRYLNTDELAQEKDGAQIALVKKAVKEKDSQLLVWLSDIYGDYFKSTEEFGKQSTPDQFFLLGLLPFLKFEELTGSNGEAALQDLINFYPGRSDLFEAYVAQGLPLKGQILASPVKKTPVGYVVHNFDDLCSTHGADTVFDLISRLHKLGADINEYSGDGTCPFMNAIGKDDKLARLLLELGADGDFVSQAGTVCKCGEDIADVLMAESNYYKEHLKDPNTNLYLYFEATEGPDGKEFAQTCLKYFKLYSPEHALALVYIQLQSDLGITIGSKHYTSPDELTQEKDKTQIDLLKKAITEKDSLLLVWLTGKYEGIFDSTDAYGKLTIPNQFFLLGLLPFLSYKELAGVNWEQSALSHLQFLIDNVPRRSELFEAYVRQGLPLKGQILDSLKKTAIDYVVCNFNYLEKHGTDTVFNLIRLLCKLGADINENSSDGKCPLVNTIESNNVNLVNLLLELGADSNLQRELLEREDEYNSLVQLKNKAKTEKEYQDLAGRFRAMNGYKNTIELANECENKYHTLKNRREERKREKLKKLVVAVIVMLIIAGICVFSLDRHNRKSSLYGQATAALSEGEYKTAVNTFQSLGGFRDAKDKLLQIAETFLSAGDRETAVGILQALGDYSAAKEKLLQIAETFLSAGDNKTAIGILQAMGNYSAAKDKLLQLAEAALSEDDRETAIGIFQVLGSSSDVKMKLSQVTLEKALSEGDYETAVNAFEAMNGSGGKVILLQTAAEKTESGNEGAINSFKSLTEALDLISQNARSGGNYMIILKKNQKILPATLDYDGKQVTITLKASEGSGMPKVRFKKTFDSGALFTVKEGVTFVLEDGVDFQGGKLFTDTLVNIDGGNFIMNGGALSDSNGSFGLDINSGTFTMNGGKITGNGHKIFSYYGAGVNMNGGTFIMNNGEISKNGGTGGTGGVSMNGGTFTMTGGTISGNDGISQTGGVTVRGDATFNMRGGTISGNTGNGVYVSYTIDKEKAVFTKSGGIIYGSDAPEGQANIPAVKISRGELTGGSNVRWGNNEDVRNTTADESTALDSSKRGKAGGWE
jgi:serine/threonine protein kinase